MKAEHLRHDLATNPSRLTIIAGVSSNTTWSIKIESSELMSHS